MSLAPLWGLLHGNNLDSENLGIPLNKEGYYFNPNDPFNPVIYSKGLVYASLGFHQIKALGLELSSEQLQEIAEKTNLLHIQGLNKTEEEIEDMVLSFAKKAETLAKQGKWKEAFSIIEKKAGLSLYLKFFDEIPSNQKWETFVTIYTRSEAGFEILEPHYERIFEFAPLSKERNKRIRKLAKKVQSHQIDIYHGAKKPGSIEDPKDSYSWSLDIGVAEWFAKRFGTDGKVYKATIPIKEATDYLNDRDEEEILWNQNKSEVKPHLIKTFEGGEWK